MYKVVKKGLRELATRGGKVYYEAWVDIQGNGNGTLHYHVAHDNLFGFKLQLYAEKVHRFSDKEFAIKCLDFSIEDELRNLTNSYNNVVVSSKQIDLPLNKKR